MNMNKEKDREERREKVDTSEVRADIWLKPLLPAEFAEKVKMTEMFRH